MIDGLESESAGRVCVMMTAMNVAHLPPALVRSGRVELWLEMKLPDPQARADILANLLSGLPDEMREVDVPRLIAATEGFTGADLKRLVEDGKAIYAYDRANEVKVMPTTNYFMRAVEAVKRTNSIMLPPRPWRLRSPNLPCQVSLAPLQPSERSKPMRTTVDEGGATVASGVSPDVEGGI